MRKHARMRKAALALALLASGCAVGVSSAGGADRLGGEQLQRHRPILRYDSNEAHFAQPISRDGTSVDRDLVYGHAARDDGKLWLQYWLFYSQNTQDRGLLRTGRHEGDWEFVQLRLGDDERLETATYAQHSSAERCSLSELEVAKRGAAEVPVVYIANSRTPPIRAPEPLIGPGPIRMTTQPERAGSFALRSRRSPMPIPPGSRIRGRGAAAKRVGCQASSRARRVPASRRMGVGTIRGATSATPANAPRRRRAAHGRRRP